MAMLFRDVRLDGIEVAVAHHDKEDRMWMAWPEKEFSADAPTDDARTRSKPFQTTLADLQHLSNRLREFVPTSLPSHETGFDIDTRHVSNVKHFTWYPEPSRSPLKESILHALLPFSASLTTVSQADDELYWSGIDNPDFCERLVELFFKNHEIPSPGKYANRSLFLGFKRRYLHATIMTPLIWKLLDSMQRENSAYAGTTGSTTLQQIISSAEIPLILRKHSFGIDNVLGAGNSFTVTIAKIGHESNLPPYKDGSPRKQWEMNSLVAFKRPRTKTKTHAVASFQATQNTRNASNPQVRVSNAVINELLVLSHPPLRNHPNLVHLFGIAWDSTPAINSCSTYDPYPILVQSCADQGSLDQYMTYMMLTGMLSWTIQCDIIKQILAGLRDLHACGIVHGDIKPANILVARGIYGKAKPRVMISDFGHSMITQNGQEWVQVTGATKRYASPEIFRCLEGSESIIPLKDALASDVYSFGLTACSVVLRCSDSQDVFDEVSCRVSQLPTQTQTQTQRPKIDWLKEIKTNPAVHDGFVEIARVFMMQEEAKAEVGLEKSIVHRICRCLEGSSDNKLEVIHGFIEHLAEVVKDTRLHGAELLRSEHIYNEIRLSASPIKRQILDDFTFKSKPLIESTPLEWPALRRRFGLRKWAEIVFAAFQVYVCYLFGIGTEPNLVLAGKYVARYPDIVLRGWTPNLQGLFLTVLTWPLTGSPRHLEDLRLLHALAPQLAREAVDTFNEAGFSEVGELNDHGRQLDEGTFFGPDIRYQWFARGSLELFQRVVSSCSLSELIQGFQSGDFPTDATNYNNETVLYMCCRIGASEIVLGLLEEFEWCRQQTTIATLDGRFPLHLLYTFPKAKVAQVGEALLARQANVDAVDLRGFRAIDYAIQVGREDVVTHLINHHTTPFASEVLRSSDATTLREALRMNSPAGLRNWLTYADRITKLKVFNSLMTCNEIIFSPGFPSTLSALTWSIGRLPAHDMKSNLGETIQQTLVCAQIISNVEGFNSIVQNLLPEEGLAIDYLVPLLVLSTFDLHLAQFSRVLDIKAPWTALRGYEILQVLMDFGEVQHKVITSMLVTLVSHLDNLGLLRQVVNYVPQLPRASECCENTLNYWNSKPLFCNLIRSGNYEVARLVAPFMDHDDCTPSPMYYLLTKPGAHILEDIEFLLKLEEHHRPYICHPVYKTTALHVVTKFSGKPQHMLDGWFPTNPSDQKGRYGSPTKLPLVLETLLEHFIEFHGQDINALDANGYTALMQAVDSVSPEGVSLLLDWGADPTFDFTTDSMNCPPFDQKNSIVLESELLLTPCEFLLVRIFIWDMFAGFEKGPKKTTFSLALPFAWDLPSQPLVWKLRQLELLTLLSSPGEKTTAAHLQSLCEQNNALIGLPVRSFMPATSKRRVQLVERENGSLYLDIWGFYVFQNVKLSVYITSVDNGLTEKEIRAKQSYIERTARADSLYYASTFPDSRTLRHYVFEDNEEGYDQSDWIGPEGVITWRMMTDDTGLGRASSIREQSESSHMPAEYVEGGSKRKEGDFDSSLKEWRFTCRHCCQHGAIHTMVVNPVG
ncbi:hypothetical protein FDECE_13157 [Fusarium decemcellulare]|nr:hypothetical protein FDECE_13157 [Fusarium decemcellulare]